MKQIRKLLCLLLTATMLLGIMPTVSASSELNTAEDMKPLIWYDVSSLTAEDGAKIEKLENKANPGTYDAVQSDNNKQPAYVAKSVIGNQPALSMTSDVSMQVEGSNTLNLNEMAIFAVVRASGIESNSDNNQIFSKLGDGGRHNVYFNFNADSKFNYGYRCNGDNTWHDCGGDGNKVSLDTNYILAGTKCGAQAQLYINGESVGTMDCSGKPVETDSFFYLGGSDGSKSMKGEFCELIVYNRALTDDEVADVHEYLSEKYLKDDDAAQDDAPLIWYDASSLTAADGDKVATLVNKANPGTYDAVQSDASKQPVYEAASAIGGRPALKMTGDVSMQVDGSSALNLNEMAIFAVVRASEITQNGDKNQIFSKLAGQHTLYFNINGASKFNYGFYCNGDNTWHDCPSDKNGVATDTNYILTGTKANGTLDLYINGENVGSMNCNGQPTVNDCPYYLGGGGTSVAESMKGELCELIVYNRALTDEEIADIHNYLSEKYLQERTELPEGAAIWYDASELTLEDGASVSRLENKASPGTYDAVQSEERKQPVYTKNGSVGNMPALKMAAGSSLKVENSEAINWKNMTILSVVRADSVANDSDKNQIFSKLGTSAPLNHSWYYNISGDSYFNFGYKTTDNAYHDCRTDGNKLKSSTNYILIGEKDGENARLYVNGILSKMSGSADNVMNNDAVYVGAGTRSESLKGEICEIIAYDKALSAEELAQAQTYLAQKYQIQTTQIIDDEMVVELALYVDGEQIREFSSNCTSYRRVLESGTTAAPEVTANAAVNGKDAAVQVTQASGVPGTATVSVPSLNKTYTVHFSAMDKELANLKEPELTDVTLLDGFWKNNYDTYYQKTLEFTFDLLVRQGAIDNYEKVIAGTTSGARPYPWHDGLLLETIRAAGDFMLVADKNSEQYKSLKERIDGYVDVIYRASLSSENGYLSTWAMIQTPGRYFDATGNARWYHDAYNFGCMAEAAVHYYEATGDLKLLYAACRFATFISDNYGYGTKADGSKKINMVPSHALPEEALLTLYKLLEENPALVSQLNTLDSRYTLDIRPENYADLVKFWVENHGNYDNRVNGANYGDYAQDSQYYFDQERGTGHAVRANLYYTGIAAAGLEFQNYTYLDSVDRIWTNIAEKQMYVTGAVGAIGADEAYGADYELPNDGYAETCAAAAYGFASQYLQRAFGESTYADVLETELYNGVLGSIGLEGTSFTYQNPLNTGSASRWTEHDCPCCPPMLLKFYAQLQKYIYTYNNNAVYVNQFISSEAVLANGVAIRQETNMPWEGTATFAVSGKATTLYLRVPSWTEGAAVSVRVNGEAYSYTMKDGYAVVPVNAGDTVTYTMELQARRVYADSNVEADKGKVSLAYGPVVYCLETVDNALETADSEILCALPKDAELRASYEKNLLGGVVVISTNGQNSAGETLSLKAVPYYARGNRGASGAYVWIGEEIEASPIRRKNYLATATSTSHIENSPSAAFDGNGTTKWTASNASDVQYLAVDLGQAQDIGKVTLAFDSDQAWHFNVLYSLDGITWETYTDLSGNTTPQADYSFENTVNARYVAAEFIDTPVGYVSIYEMQVFAPNSETNLALNKLCGASGCMYNGKSAFALFDGQTKTRYCPNGESKPQSVTMDLGETAQITAMDILFEKPTNWTYNIQVSEDGVNWTEYVNETFQMTEDGTWHTVSKTASGRYVKVEITGTTGGVWGSAWELDIKTTSQPQTVIERLKLRDTQPAAPDKSALQAAYDKGSEKVEANYTAESWNAYQKALENAKRVLDDADATQAQIDAAKEALDAAEQGLAAICQHVHTELRNASEATTEKEGYTGDLWCLDCNTMIQKGTVIPKLEKPEKPGKPSRPSHSGSIISPNKPAASLPFTDVAVSDWYYASVRSAWENRLIDGVTETKYAPDQTLTVAQAVKLAAALHQLEMNGKVALSNGSPWYSTYVTYAVNNDIIEKEYLSYTAEQMNAPISRVEFVHIFYGATNSYKVLNQVADNAVPDVKTTDRYGSEIYTFYRAGILTGSDENGTFHPTSSIKRSEVATILTRMYDASQRQIITLP